MEEEELESILYVRGMNSDENNDIWDDTVLNNAYDKALRMANDDVAKRIAMKTNSKVKDESDIEEIQEKKPKHKKGKSESKQSSEWKEGMPCRAVYEDDGIEYEAFLMKILNHNDCIVKFLGYENTQKVAISTLTPTQGNDACMKQVAAALCERNDNGFESQPSVHSQGSVSPVPVERSGNKKKKSQKKKKNHPNSSCHIGDLPHLPMPNLDMFKNMNSTMPMPPPPPLSQLSARTDAEEQAISDMLLSWYMTGYYTGLYQGMKRSQNGKNN